MQRLNWLKIICFINIISFIVTILLTYKNSRITSLFSSIINSTRLHSIEKSFEYERTNQLLGSYSYTYDQSQIGCNITAPLTSVDKHVFSAIPIKLATLLLQVKPYPNEYFQGRGIVLTAGSSQLKFAIVNLKMIEITRTKLPVQIWYSSEQIPHEDMISLLSIAPNLNASVCCFHSSECRTLTEVWQLNTSYVYQPPSSHSRAKFFPYKPAAIISSTFAEVLFLDCDAYVTRDPEPLFTSDPMYQQFGALFFPDAIKSRQHPDVWQLFNTSCAQDEYEFDSAMILVDKRKVWNGLYMAKLMNDNYRNFYKFVTDGDKDTFRLAFRYMQIKYYLVMIPCSTGPFNGSHFCGLSLCKTDSLGQHIYVNHLHLYKYEHVKYSSTSLEYTRIGLGDPNNNTFLFQHCKTPNSTATCFRILKEFPEQMTQGTCYDGTIPKEEIEDHQYMFNESLISEKSKNNRVLISRTNNFMPDFVDNVIKFAKLSIKETKRNNTQIYHVTRGKYYTRKL